MFCELIYLFFLHCLGGSGGPQRPCRAHYQDAHWDDNKLEAFSLWPEADLVNLETLFTPLSPRVFLVPPSYWPFCLSPLMIPTAFTYIWWLQASHCRCNLPANFRDEYSCFLLHVPNRCLIVTKSPHTCFLSKPDNITSLMAFRLSRGAEEISQWEKVLATRA